MSQSNKRSSSSSIVTLSQADRNAAKRAKEENQIFDDFDVHDHNSVLAIAAIYEAKQQSLPSDESNSSQQRKICKFWESNVSYDPNNESRLEYLMRMPKLLFGCMNAGDRKSVKKILQEAFQPDCQLRTSALGHSVIGVDKIRDLILSLFAGSPDLIITHTDVEYNLRVLSCTMISHGTLISETPDGYLHDDLKHDKKNKNKEFLEQKKLLQTVRKAGYYPRFRGSEFVHFIINKDLTHIENFILIRKDIKVFPSSA